MTDSTICECGKPKRIIEGLVQLKYCDSCMKKAGLLKPKRKTKQSIAKVAKEAKNALKCDVFTKICQNKLKIEVVKEFKFHPTRKWRFDYAIPNLKIALEVEGGAWTNGRHTRGAGFIADMEKYNAGTLLGWRIFRVTPDTLITDKTLKMLDCAIKYDNVNS